MNVEALKNYLEQNNKLRTGMVRLFLMNGYQMHGTITKMEDGWLVFVDKQNEEQTIFYHAISTIK